ncbi:putative rRNA-processing protein EBP2 -like protein [Babesia sp. Xinjiang]|uniref:putative rRNA-processing protein EBP2 -like protein n=1 Tax=Babesia sp. Xinjiang TaxID=462227 RepID=UPI000A258647|nr:putative rRNA-processing protein EBP2 -like protein [Babesia sp. Xinjiang]ORM40347.1 putative rRNA-processing protein EBP2 -like protein [Babesia sp. Xinjiang]
MQIVGKIQEILSGCNGKELPWIETLSVTHEQPCRNDFDCNETLKIEAHFKEIASSCVKGGLQQLAALGVDFNRPTDFYADMIKSDVQMERVMKKIAKRTKKIQEKSSKQNVKVKKGFDKQVKQRQRKNEFIKDMAKLMKNRNSNISVEKQMDHLMESHAGVARKGRTHAELQESAKRSIKTNNKASKGRKYNKTQSTVVKNSQGKVLRRKKDDKNARGRRKKK